MAIPDVEVAPDVAGYVMDIVEATRQDPRIRTGVSTRGALALYRAGQAKAAISGRSYVTPEDIKYLAPAVLAHRISTAGYGRMKDDEAIIIELTQNCKVPLERV